MDLGLTGRRALVLGAGGGLGSAIACKLGVEGAAVVAADINVEGANETAKAVNAVGGKAMAMRWDLAELDAIDGHISRIETELGPVDILVAITGGPPPGPASG